MGNLPPEAGEDIGDVDDTASILPRRRPLIETDIDITPMIDIVFLLLIFFIVTSKLSDAGSVELPEARYGDAVSTKESVIITISKGPDERPLIYKGDTSSDPQLLVGATDPAARELEIADYVEATLAGPPRKQYVLIKAARGVKHGDVAHVQRAVGRVANVNQVFVAVLEVQ